MKWSNAWQKLLRISKAIRPGTGLLNPLGTQEVPVISPPIAWPLLNAFFVARCVSLLQQTTGYLEEYKALECKYSLTTFLMCHCLRDPCVMSNVAAGLSVSWQPSFMNYYRPVKVHEKYFGLRHITVFFQKHSASRCLAMLTYRDLSDCFSRRRVGWKWT